MHRVFLDSNILIAAAASPTGASNAVLTMAEIGLIEAVISRQVIDECERNVRKKLPTALPAFVGLLTQIPFVIVETPSLADYQRWMEVIEEKDAPIVEAALQSNSQRILTLNSKDFTPNVAAAASILIQPPAEFIHVIRAIVAEQLAEER